MGERSRDRNFEGQYRNRLLQHENFESTARNKKKDFKILNFKCSVYRDIGQNVEDGKGPVVSARESGRRANGRQGTQPSTDEPVLDQASNFSRFLKHK